MHRLVAIKYSLSATMLGYWVGDCACIRELAPSVTTSAELANPIILNVLQPIGSTFGADFTAIRLL